MRGPADAGVLLQPGLHLEEIVTAVVALAFGSALLVVITPLKLGAVWFYARWRAPTVRRSRLAWVCLLTTVLSVPLYVLVFLMRRGAFGGSEANFALGLFGLWGSAVIVEAVVYRVVAPELGARRCAAASVLANTLVLLAAAEFWIVLRSSEG
jgi:hypothetical protein